MGAAAGTFHESARQWPVQPQANLLEVVRGDHPGAAAGRTARPVAARWRRAVSGWPRAVRALSSTGASRSRAGCPPSAALATALGVSRATVTAAYDQLREEGYIASRQGVGSWVTLPGGTGRRPDAIVGRVRARPADRSAARAGGARGPVRASRPRAAALAGPPRLRPARASTAPSRDRRALRAAWPAHPPRADPRHERGAARLDLSHPRGAPARPARARRAPELPGRARRAARRGAAASDAGAGDADGWDLRHARGGHPGATRRRSRT